MTSLFDELFRESAATMLMEYAAEETLVTLKRGDTTIQSGINAMLGHIEVVEVEYEDGVIRKEYRRTMSILRDAGSKWKGYDDPQLKMSVEIGSELWSIEDRAALAIEGKSETFVTFMLVRKKPTNKAYSGFRRIQ